MISNDTTFYIVAAAITLLIVAIATVIYFAFIRKNKSSYDDQLQDLIHYDGDGVRSHQVSIVHRWNRYWGERVKVISPTGYADGGSKAGRDAALLTVVSFIILSIVLRNPIPALFVTAGLLYLVSVLLKGRADKASEEINAQLPAFLFALKANVQANKTPERAILKVVDSMPKPLYDDLVVVKQRILANSSFKEAIQELGTKTASRDLKFLCACMVQAAETGTNLEKQIEVIQKVLESRRRVSAELEKAIRQASPAIWVASIVIPASFLGTYFMSPQAREFWFIDPLSYVSLVLVGLLYLAGVWMVKKLVDNIKNL